MNKNNLFSSLTLLGLFVFSSCNLDLAPEDTLSPKTYFKNGPQLELWTNHFYSLFPDVDDLAKQNADDNISSELGETLMGQRSDAGFRQSHWNAPNKERSGACNQMDSFGTEESCGSL